MVIERIDKYDNVPVGAIVGLAPSTLDTNKHKAIDTINLTNIL